MKLRVIIFLSILSTSFFNSIKAQTGYSLGLIGGLDYKKHINDDWTINPQLFNRFAIASGDFNNSDVNERTISHLLLDADVFAVKKLNERWHWENAFLIRFQGGDVLYRFIEGAEWKKKYAKWALSQRFRADANYGTSFKPIYRLRYRIKGGIPIFKKVEHGSWNFTMSLESVNKFQSDEFVSEFRWVSLMERTFCNKNQFEFGLDYRLNHFLSSDADINSLWIIATYKFR